MGGISFFFLRSREGKKKKRATGRRGFLDGKACLFSFSFLSFSLPPPLAPFFSVSLDRVEGGQKRALFFRTSRMKVLVFSAWPEARRDCCSEERGGADGDDGDDESSEEDKEEAPLAAGAAASPTASLSTALLPRRRRPAAEARAMALLCLGGVEARERD